MSRNAASIVWSLIGIAVFAFLFLIPSGTVKLVCAVMWVLFTLNILMKRSAIRESRTRRQFDYRR